MSFRQTIHAQEQTTSKKLLQKIRNAEILMNKLGIRNIQDQGSLSFNKKPTSLKIHEQNEQSNKHRQQIQQQQQILNFDLDFKILFQDPQLQQKQLQIRQLLQLNQSISHVQRLMLQKQGQYKNLMRKHYKFVGPNKLQQNFSKFLKQKFLKNLQNYQHQMRQIYQIGGRSSISSSSVGNYAIQDWVNQQKQDKVIKQQQKLLQEIAFLEKQFNQL